MHNVFCKNKKLQIIKSYICYPVNLDLICNCSINGIGDFVRYVNKIKEKSNIEEIIYEHIKYHKYGVVKIFDCIFAILLKAGDEYICLPVYEVIKDSLIFDIICHKNGNCNDLSVVKYLCEYLDNGLCYAKNLNGKFYRWSRSEENVHSEEKLPYVSMKENQLIQDDDFGLFFTESNIVIEYIGYGDQLIEVCFDSKNIFYPEIENVPIYKLGYTLAGEGSEYYSNKIITRKVISIYNPDILNILLQYGGNRTEDIIMGRISGNISIENILKKRGAIETLNKLEKLRENQGKFKL